MMRPVSRRSEIDKRFFGGICGQRADDLEGERVGCAAATAQARGGSNAHPETSSGEVGDHAELVLQAKPYTTYLTDAESTVIASLLPRSAYAKPPDCWPRRA